MFLPQLNITRFFAALSIVVLHFGIYTWPFNLGGLSQIIYKSLSAVSYFFVLSGFILVVSSVKMDSLPDKISAHPFWINRAARILPVYVFAIVIYFVLHFHYHPDIPLSWQTTPYIYALFLIQSWNYHTVMDINFPAWTLSVEACFYFIFPWLFWNLNHCKTKRLISISLIAWIGNSFIFTMLLKENVPHSFSYYFPLLHVATFMQGIIAGILFVRHYTFLTRKTTVLWIGSILTGVFLLYAAYTDMHFFTYSYNGLLAPFFVLIIYTLSVSKGYIRSLFSLKPLVFLGDISYSLYILQVPVMEIAIKYIPWFEGRDRKDIFYYYVGILICSSAFTYWVIEKPIRKFIRKLVSPSSMEISFQDYATVSHLPN